MKITNITSAKYRYENEAKYTVEVELSDSTHMSIIISNDNIDYQKVLEWVAAGNTITDPGA
tara:strand:+ start:3566 stop:3748 length:183 start_codon:yes stop_codon:yes gene_type:complete